MTVKIEVKQALSGKDRVYCTTPYHPGMSARARALGGKWHAGPKYWSFDVRDKGRVEEMCRTLFGMTGAEGETVEVVTLAVTLGGESGHSAAVLGSGDEAWICGRQIARRPGRDMAVRLGEGVIILEGTFPSSGGSRNSPSLFNFYTTNTVVLEVRDVPKPLAEAAVKKYPDAVKVQE